MISKYIRGITLWISTIVSSVFFASLVFILYPFTYIFDKQRHSVHFIAIIWAQTIRYCNPWWKFKIYGRKNLAPNNSAAVYISNHQSQADIIALFILNTRFRWMSKASVFKIPFLGWAMALAGYVPIERGNRASQEKCMLLSAEHIKNGTPMAFFPEGTRSTTGTPGPFKTGAFRLAQATGVPIIPVSIQGCDKLLPKHSIFPQRASVKITVHPAIQSTEYDLETLVEKSRKAVVSGL